MTAVMQANIPASETSTISVHMCVCVHRGLPKPLDFLCFSFINILFRQECVPAVVSGVGVKPFPGALSKSAADISNHVRILSIFEAHEALQFFC